MKVIRIFLYISVTCIFIALLIMLNGIIFIGSPDPIIDFGFKMLAVSYSITTLCLFILILKEVL